MISKKEINKIAKLAKIYFCDAEMEILIQDLNNMINFADEINDANFTITKKYSEIDEENVFRKDEILKSFDKKLILKNANEQENGFFALKQKS